MLISCKEIIFKFSLCQGCCDKNAIVLFFVGCNILLEFVPYLNRYERNLYRRSSLIRFLIDWLLQDGKYEKGVID